TPSHPAGRKTMAAVEPRILTLQIDKISSGLYRAEVQSHNVQVADEGTHPSISEAIRKEALAVPDGFAHFMEVRYCGLSSGTFAIAEMAQQADVLADRLMELLAEMHRVAEG